MTNDDIILQISQYDLPTLYANFLAAATENELDIKDINDIKYGTTSKLPFDIRDTELFENNEYAIKKLPKLQQVRIFSNIYPLSDYRDEMERRATLMRNYLFAVVGQGNPWKPRYT